SRFSSLWRTMMMSPSAILPPLKKKQCSIPGIGHFYFAEIGHYHFAVTAKSEKRNLKSDLKSV
ncbi:MAG TPA: hypothetical protein VKF36_20055, partial [Syntrophorhabdales bacterium]|nr:hypothetical protein [Syntrophorhabdales bacterium]